MKKALQANSRVIFYLLLLLFGLLQAGLSEIQDDEAYYWVYSRYPDWGYFDHPPMIAFLIKAGYAIIPNELGVRLFPVMLFVLSVLVMEKLTAPKNPLLFYAVFLSMATLQLTAHMAVPDIPLLFFTALFFLCYQRFIRSSNFLNIFLLGLSIALLFYTKYQATLVVVLVVLSNPRLLLRKSFWVASLFALLLFLPHLWWQYEHDWLSFKYHLLESNVNLYKIRYTLGYFLGQLFLMGPIASLILVPAAILYKPKDKLENGFRFVFIGTLVFFLLSSFRGKVEANWTAPALIVLIPLAYKFLEENPLRKWLFRLLPLSLAFTLFGRIALIADIIPVHDIKLRYHSWKNWPTIMKEKTKGLPIVFENSYQRASRYWFHTGQMTYSQNSYKDRKNNFNFWPVEDSMLGKPVYMLDIYGLGKFEDSLPTPIGWVGYNFDSSFASFAKIKITVQQPAFRVRLGDSLELHCRFKIPAHYKKFIASKTLPSHQVIIGLFKNNTWVKDIPTGLTLIPGREFEIIKVDPAENKGSYSLRFTIAVEGYHSSHNSDNIKLQIE